MTIWETAKRESQRGVSLIDALEWLLASERFRDDGYASDLIHTRNARREKIRLEAEQAREEAEKRQRRLHPHEPLAPTTTRQRRKAQIAGLLS